MVKPSLVSGIQPTGQLHIGNYLGALKNFVDLQNSSKYQCYFFIADLHALIENPKPKDLQKNIRDLIISFLAAGLNPNKSILFIQSKIPAHTELTWILNTIAPVSELQRMTQFKEKSKINGQESGVNMGLFDYPVLMAVDILLYDPQFVPVGEDQLQHLEFVRTLARKFNKKFGKTFIEPKPLLTKTSRLMSLDEPTKKMSKSKPAGCLFLDDSPAVIRKKIKRAVTDSGQEIKYDLKNKPAISNLLLIYSSLSDESIKVIEKKFSNKGYAEFKNKLAEVVIKALKPFQEKKKKLQNKDNQIKAILKKGNLQAQKVANKKLFEAKNKIGII